MRTGLLLHGLGVLITLGFFLQLWSNVIAVLLQSRSQDAISKTDIANGTGPLTAETQLIPKIIHQVYNMWSNGTIPKDWEEAQQSCLSLNADYEYKLWNYETSREFLENEYPWFLETFDNYEFPVQRADSIRYFILSHFGGIYLDLDTGCNTSLDQLLTYPAFVAAAPALGLTNSIMGCAKNHPFFQFAAESLPDFDINWGLPYLTIMNSAGPHFVSEVWVEYLHSFTIDGADHPLDPATERVRLLMPAERHGNPWSVFYPVRGKSWHNWDNTLFLFVHNHVPLIVFALVTGMVLLACVIWWAVWRSFCRLRSLVYKVSGWRKYAQDFDLPLLPVWYVGERGGGDGSEKGLRLED